MQIQSRRWAILLCALTVLAALVMTAGDADAARRRRKGKEKKGTLTKQQISRVLNENKATVWGCYEDAKARKEGAEGTVTITWKVYPDGHVEDPEVVESTLADAEAEACMAKEIKLWQFPEPEGDGIVVISIPFNFKYVPPPKEETEGEGEAGAEGEAKKKDEGAGGEAKKKDEGDTDDAYLLGDEFNEEDKNAADKKDKKKGKKAKKKSKKAKKKKKKGKQKGDVW